MTNSERHAAFRARHGDKYRTNDAARKRTSRALEIPQFVGVDGEGVGRGKNHKYVLLTIGETHYENRDGIHWAQAFDWLYREFQLRPNAAFVGFYLGYDYSQIFKSLPEQKAWYLFTKAGRAQRAIDKPRYGMRLHPVRCNGWEFDMPIGINRVLNLRPLVCDCHQIPGIKCEHTRPDWMTICDSGPCWQTSLMNVIDPKQWKDDPDGPICTGVEYGLLEKGKKRRSTAVLDDEMRMYNSLENVILARAMHRLAKGLCSAGIHLSRTKWYGPGAAADKWLSQREVPERTKLEKIIPARAYKACKQSYYGGWFEIFSHGILPGKTYNYDINSAYPYAISRLPCLLHGKWTHGTGKYRNKGSTGPHYILYDARICARSDRIGPLPHRRKDGGTYRPDVTRGWYWADEINAASRAGLVDRLSGNRYYEWWAFEPECDHRPFADMVALYEGRLKEDGSKAHTAESIAKKLVMNSVYGKNSQTIGSMKYANWFYASLITASCRIQILDAIATHPGGADSVVMVATDGICFDSSHNSLSQSAKLGEWECKEYRDLLLFKPGVYWQVGIDKDKALRSVKARGVPKREFVEVLSNVEQQFREFADGLARGEMGEWPAVSVPLEFSIITPVQSLMRGKWDLAGTITHDNDNLQSSFPFRKRGQVWWNSYYRRIQSSVIHLEYNECQSTPYKKLNLGGPSPVLPDGTAKSIMGEYIEALQGGKITWVTAGVTANGE